MSTKYYLLTILKEVKLIIIIEGPDLAGKSTLVKQLNINNDFEVVHFDKPVPNFDFHESYLNVLDKENVILDRYFFSEIVYSKIFGRQCKVSKETVQQIKEKLKNKPHQLIFVNPGIDTLKRRYRERGDEIISESQIEKIVQEYENLFFGGI